MGDITGKNFGVVIAFLLPGFLLLSGLSYFFPLVGRLFFETLATEASTSVGGFLYALLGSLALGMLISAIRWATIDKVMRLYCEPISDDKFDKLNDANVLGAFERIVENHYRFYQYYSNTMVSVFFIFMVTGFSLYTDRYICLYVLGFLVILIILFLASKDCYIKYCTRASRVLSA